MGAVIPGNDIEAIVELKARLGTTQIFEFNHKVRLRTNRRTPDGSMQGNILVETR
jgi:hypothetical protein